MPQFEVVNQERPPMDVARQEKVPVTAAQQETSLDGAAGLINFVDENYFQNFLNKLDAIEEENKNKPVEERVNITKVGDFLGVDIAKMRIYIDEKIPDLIQKINAMVNDEQVAVVKNNSMQDVLGNSILTIFNRILWVLENFHSVDPVAKEKIFNPQSRTRKVIDLYSKNEGQAGVASYYVDNLCADSEKLKLEISTNEGFLKNYQEYFHDIVMDGQTTTYYPRGGKKLPYFKFFNELELGHINTGNVEDALSGLDDRIIDVEKIRKSALVRNVH